MSFPPFPVWPTRAAAEFSTATTTTATTVRPLRGAAEPKGVVHANHLKVAALGRPDQSVRLVAAARTDGPELARPAYAGATGGEFVSAPYRGPFGFYRET